MPQSLFRPFEIKFRGLDAEQHVIDAIYLGESLIGTGRLYNSVAHFYFQGEIRRRPKDAIRMNVGPPEKGTITYLIWALLAHGTLAVYPELLCEFADLILPEFIKVIFSRKAGRRSEMDKALEIIQQQMTQQHQLTKMVMHDNAVTKDKLFELVETLTKNNSSALAEIAAPVGRTVRQVEHFASSPQPYIIDEPIAEAFRSKEEAEVGEQEILEGVLYAVDKAAGTCKSVMNFAV